MQKIISILCFICALTSCYDDKIDTKQAEERAVLFLTAIADSQWTTADKFYTDNFQKSEPFENRAIKFNKLREITGKTIEVKLLNAVNEQPTGEESKVTLTYLLKGEKKDTKHILIMMRDEGEIKIAFHSIMNN